MGQNENPYSLEVRVIKNEQAIKLLQQQQAQLYLKMENLLVKYGEIKGQLDTVVHQLQTLQNQINQLMLKQSSQQQIALPKPPTEPAKPSVPEAEQPKPPVQKDVSTQSQAEQGKPKVQLKEDEVAFKGALDLFKKKKYDAAIDAFKAFKNKYKQSKWIDDAVFYLAECYFNKGQYDRAIINYDYLVNTYPKSDKVAAATLKEGIAFIRMGDKVDGNYLLQKVIKQFPNTPEAKEAKKILKKGGK